MPFYRQLEYRCGLSNSMDSFGPVENTSASEDSILIDMEKDFPSWNDSDNSSYSNGGNSSESEGSSIKTTITNENLTKREDSKDLDETQKYKHLWIECENCYGLNYRKIFDFIWQILQKINPLLAYKSQNPLLDDNSKHSFLNTLMERVYLNIFLCIILICSIDVQLFLESKTKKKSIYNNEENVERTDQTNKSLTYFISLLKRSYDLRNTNSHKFCDVSSLSQAYVFFKLSETQVINIYKLKYVFAYHRKSPFLKNEIKDYFFGIQRIFDFQFISKNPPNSLMNQWTNWLLKSHYQYDLSQRRWSRLGNRSDSISVRSV
ncbi:hypothetical protein AHAS_AhasUnG0003200 [Arachis hypogaea]